MMIYLYIYRTVLLNREETIASLVERCMLEYSDDLLVNVCTLLQLPLRRISEYHELLEKIQLQLEVCFSLINKLTYRSYPLYMQRFLSEITVIMAD